MNILNIKTPLQKWNAFFLALSCFLKNMEQAELPSEQAIQDWPTSNFFFDTPNFGGVVDKTVGLSR